MNLDATRLSAQFFVIGKFLLAYLAVLAMPGPNMLAIGGVAALRGFQAVIPFCLGIAVGAGALAGLLYSAAVAIPKNDVWQMIARIAGALLLLVFAGRVAILRLPSSRTRARKNTPNFPSYLGEFSAGFCTAMTNPITSAYFAAEFVGPLSALSGTLPVAITLAAIPVLALLSGLITAIVLARALARRTALAWHRSICITVAVALVVLAVSIMQGHSVLITGFREQAAGRS